MLLANQGSELLSSANATWQRGVERDVQGKFLSESTIAFLLIFYAATAVSAAVYNGLPFLLRLVLRLQLRGIFMESQIPEMSPNMVKEV